MTPAAALLAAYDAQLRGLGETPGAIAVTTLGPLFVATFAEGRRFISYRALTSDDGTPLDAAGVHALVAAVAQHLLDDPGATEAEWKTRAHDVAPGLDGALREHGFEPEHTESIMIGEAQVLADADTPLPDGVTLRRITSEADVRSMASASSDAFGEPLDDRYAQDLLRRQEQDPDMELWIAEAGGVIVTTGRLEPVAGTEFAGIWGGATLPEWRHRGIYRALTAVRARSAIAAGKRYLQSDSTEYSRPILERNGFQKVSETTPYVWHR
ncbi:MAG: GNAT family N-acetyltransferase [Promicromonosporaceae bacterium]|nr:GNAT family N-acetyltransferase [Promicromonosporaceae bacterium]